MISTSQFNEVKTQLGKAQAALEKLRQRCANAEEGDRKRQMVYDQVLRTSVLELQAIHSALILSAIYSGALRKSADGNVSAVDIAASIEEFKNVEEALSKPSHP